MKIIKYIIPIILLVGSLYSCDNADDMKDVIFFTGTEQTPIVKYSLEKPERIGLSIKASTKVTQEVKIKVNVNEDLVDQYNEKNGTSYKKLPTEIYALEAGEVVIKEEKFVSEPFFLDINSLDQFRDEDIFCLPIEISNVNGGGLSVLEASRTMYVLLNKTIVTQSMRMDGTYFAVDFKSDQGRDLSAVPQLTIETRIYPTDFQNSNPYISTIIGIEEHFLLRMGDVTVDRDKLQLAGGGYPVASTVAVSANKWTHVAVTYDGKKISLYIDGVLNAYTDAPRGPIDLTKSDNNRSFYIGTTSNSTSRTFKGYMSETRVWTRALSSVELANGKCAVAADAPDLLAYWKFNSFDSDKDVVVDYTGHGYDAVRKGKGVSWLEGVRCP